MKSLINTFVFVGLLVSVSVFSSACADQRRGTISNNKGCHTHYVKHNRSSYKKHCHGGKETFSH